MWGLVVTEREMFLSFGVFGLVREKGCPDLYSITQASWGVWGKVSLGGGI